MLIVDPSLMKLAFFMVADAGIGSDRKRCCTRGKPEVVERIGKSKLYSRGFSSQAFSFKLLALSFVHF